ncbi:hypothetical protein GCM10012275_54030 [Longimycelium tulufanense]|uniref:Uncharacterized protein n=1 Tax=Longimycelium tulufanense TaxID=907463 RepID=A0A8J3CJJ6_9PSEU|nr:hypothetical protein [Longimycelium tulufanense]GGM76427.1 hypothetical protein GCM10012275_54030 [Longimycelium tulufanense]
MSPRRVDARTVAAHLAAGHASAGLRLAPEVWLQFSIPSGARECAALLEHGWPAAVPTTAVGGT